MHRLILLALCFPALALAQNMSNFSLFGSAQRLDEECFMLTQDAHYQNGSIQYGTAIDLTKPFQMEMEVFLGCNDALGADGIVFIFYPGRGQLGYRGEGMGFGGLAPSLGIELDTYYNDHLGDPLEDHATVMLHGRVGHWATDANPVSLGNLEDCAYHPMEINWDPAKQVLEILLDARRVVAYQADLVKDVFMGQSQVFWGVSAATAKKRNRQEVCFRKLVLGEVPDIPRLDPADVRGFLRGESLRLPEFTFAPGTVTLTSHHHSQLDQLAELLLAHPDKAVRIYAFTDSSGEAERNKSLSDARARAVKQYLAKKGIPADRLWAAGFGEAYPLASNATALGRQKNRRVEFSFVRAIP